jgi:hypothetical protein
VDRAVRLDEVPRLPLRGLGHASVEEVVGAFGLERHDLYDAGLDARRDAVDYPRAEAAVGVVEDDRYPFHRVNVSAIPAAVRAAR